MYFLGCILFLKQKKGEVIGLEEVVLFRIGGVFFFFLQNPWVFIFLLLIFLLTSSLLLEFGLESRNGYLLLHLKCDLFCDRIL